MASGSSVCLDIQESMSNAGMQRSERQRRGGRDNWKESGRIVEGVLHQDEKVAKVVSSGDCFCFYQPGSHDGRRGDSH